MGGCRWCACHSFQRFFFLFISRSTFLQTAAWTVLELSIVRPEAWCTFGKAKQVEPLSPVSPPRLPSLFTAKALQQCCSSLKRWRPEKIEKKMWQHKKRAHGSPRRRMWEKQINSSRQPRDREPHFVTVVQSLSD